MLLAFIWIQMMRKIGFQFNYRFLCYIRSICVLENVLIDFRVLYSHFTFRWKFICDSIHSYSLFQCAQCSFCKLPVIKITSFNAFCNFELHQMIESLKWLCHWKSFDVQCSQYICNDMKNQCNRQSCFLSWTRIYLYTINQLVTCAMCNEPTTLLDGMCNISWKNMSSTTAAARL